MKKATFYLLTCLFLFVYFNILSYIWNMFVPFNPMTDFISLFIVVVVLIPLSAISAHTVSKVMARTKSYE